MKQPLTILKEIHFPSFCTFIFFALSLTIPSGYSYGSTLLLLAAIQQFFFTKNKVKLDTNTKIILSSFVFFCIIWLVDIVVHDPKIRNIDKMMPFISAIIVLPYLIKNPPKINYIWAGIGAGAIGTGCLSLYLKLISGSGRVSGTMSNAIQYGNLSLLIGFMCMPGFFWALNKKSNKEAWVLMMAAGFILGTTASILSGSRGGWIGAPIIVLITLMTFRKQLSWKYTSLLLVITVTSLTAAYQMPETGLKHRIKLIPKDIALYQDGITTTSIGTRLELWKAAILLSKEKPILGWGEPEYLKQITLLKDENKINPAIVSDPHNMYLSILVFRGALGLISLLFLYISTLYIFNRIRTQNKDSFYLSTAGLILVLSYIDFGLTQTTLKFNSSVTFFAFSLILIYSSIKSQSAPRTKTKKLN